ncbi:MULTISPECIES: DUF2142 domain-containing protein [unclassified Actinobaculum]|uniref:DUF2142 domain-containing protein n=1 Tax=unclassified Actinobaculum TaxID=2609299 RepID=UPI000D52971D|nr:MULTISPECIES: DUF2142 domain-containing protein [unclassified Actinobaculum]AWE41957.1 hypothetical protein DDD63_03395 [Actinobaculum sp. 313]RTE50128.1 DUF2142 domain-containing protein [Actinobaculum sp. 352]
MDDGDAHFSSTGASTDGPQSWASSAQEGRPAERISRRAFIRCAILLTLAFMTWQAVWAIVTPPFRTPDEPTHYNSVLRGATTFDWPAVGTAGMEEGVMQAATEAGVLVDGVVGTSRRDRTVLQETEAVPSFYDAVITPHNSRLHVRYTGDSRAETRDQMTQHPPLYYWMAGRLLRTVGGSDWAWDRQLLFLRLFSVVLSAPVVPCLVYAARRIGLARHWSLTAGTLVFFVPQLAFVTAAVSNDSLSVGAGAVTIAACAAAAFGTGSWRSVVATGCALGLGLWTKGLFLPMGLVVGLAFLSNGSIGPLSRRLIRATAAGGLGVLVGGFWWVRNLIAFGQLQPDGMMRETANVNPQVGYFLRTGGPTLLHSSWGKLGWLEWQLPLPLLLVLEIGTVALVLVAFVRGRERLRLGVLLAYYPLTLLVLLGVSWRAYAHTGVVAGVQGRYLFPGIVGLLAIVAVAMALPDRRRAARSINGVADLPARSRVQTIVGVVGFLVSACSLWAWAHVCYPSGAFGIDWDRWSLVAGLDPAWLVVTACGGVLALGVAVVVPVVAGGVRDRRCQ